jgi:DnaJ-class molecular chaperone
MTTDEYKCPWCKGWGRDLSEPLFQCPDCRGTGKLIVCDECRCPVDMCECEVEGEPED